MPIFAAIAAFLARFAGTAFLTVLITRALVVLGFAAVSYVGFTALFAAVVSGIQSNLGGISADMAAILHIAGVDRGISIVLSAVSARMVLAGLTGAGVLKRMVWKGP